MSDSDHRRQPGAEQVPPLARPTPDRPARERLVAWIAWFGLGRLALTAASVVVIAAGAYWLVRAPSPTVESTLPAARSEPTSSVTLAPPVPEEVGERSTPGAPGATVDDPIRRVVVHVAGEVIHPGVYRFDEAPRVHDAIRAAGGPAPGADLDAVNLAQPIGDGQRLYVPAVGEVADSGVEVLTPPMVGENASTAAVQRIDLNRATAVELEGLPGVGPATAQAIVDDRDRNGPFASVDDLERVPGIGPARLAALRDLVTV